ncbi:hypothetical protein A9Q82_07995 [Cycloclasticus sp. 46_120_T64]|nr:hypothetical protein A9Q82_07995 [Cycloclasticus sp. 46_120_T64]
MAKYLPISLFALSIVLLVPGLTQPLMSIEATVDRRDVLIMTAEALTGQQQSHQLIHTVLQSLLQQLDIEGRVTVFKSSRSLMGTVSELVSQGHVLVGLLIGLFGVLIPVFKILLLSGSCCVKNGAIKQTLLTLNSRLSKWSMSDVFIMALVVTFLTINANEYSINTVQMTATLGSGFYFFAAYCLLAIAAAQLMERQAR